jgi:hypothetical protein
MDDVRKTVEYDGKTYWVDRVIVGTGEHITLNLEAVPELPEEPPLGETLFDDYNQPHYHLRRGWMDIHGTVRTWREMLAFSDLRRCLVAGKATDYLIRFKGVPKGGTIRESYDADSAAGAPFWGSGYTDMEAPMHGYFKRVEE